MPLAPIDLRRKAVEQIRSAEALLATSPQNAYYIAGYAVEFMLKARFCRKRGLSGLPDDRVTMKQELAKAGLSPSTNLFTHDLNDLLELCGDVRLNSAKFHKVDWDQACSWSEQLRYSRPIDVSREYAQSAIEEIRMVTDELYCYEVIEELLPIERELTSLFGLFHAFAYVWDADSRQWRVLASWVGRSEREANARLPALKEALGRLPPDILERCGAIWCCGPNEPMMRSLFTLMGMTGRGLRCSPRSLFARNCVVGLPAFPDGWIITGGRWPAALLEDYWAKCATPDPRK